MFEVSKKVKIVALVLMALSAGSAMMLSMTQPIELGREDRIMHLPPEQVVEITKLRIKSARQYVFFFWMVPFSLQRYPAHALKKMEADFKTLKNPKKSPDHAQASHSLRHHSKLIFETVDGQIRKARNASMMMTFGMCLLCLGSIFVFLGWLRMMFSFMLVGLFCIGLPIKDHFLTLGLTFFAPLCFGTIVVWLVRDNPASKVHPDDEMGQHLS